MRTVQQSMEQVLARLVDLRAAIIQALTDRFGPQPWQPAPTVPAFTRAGADDEDRPQAETVSLGTVYFPDVYPPEQWREVADTVARTAERFGFTRLVIHQDSPEGIAFAGEHPEGHIYRFGISATTVLAVRSGPAVWAAEPYRSAADLPGSAVDGVAPRTTQ
ncbi:MAG TPA: LppA family lipoprotein [Beutenbergiaceae bacterium]|nr:LppA family lipoprotein [Beutenbergiaceae bacterium]